MFRASPWISYDPTLSHSLSDPDDNDHHVIQAEPTSSQQEHHHITLRDMDAPEISTLREEEEESPPPETSFSKFRVNMRGPSWGQGAAATGSAIGPPVGPQSAGRRGPSPPDSDDEDEEDQLIDDDELAIVTETGRGPATSSPGSMLTAGNPALLGSPRKRGGIARAQGPRRVLTGRRGRPGREPPDAAAMMSTFEVAKADQLASTPPQVIPPAPVMVPNPPTPVPGPSTATSDWTTSTPPKPPRKKPGPKKGTTLGPRGPRKNQTKTAHNTPGTSTPLLDETLPTDPLTFLVPAAPPSIPPTPGPDQLPLPSSHLPPILPPDFILDPAVPVPAYPLPTRAFPVQPPPKVPTGYAPTHPIDPKRGPARKWTIMQREIKGIGGGRWFARTWVAPQNVPQSATRPSSPPAPPDAANAVMSPPQVPLQTGPSLVSAPVSRASSVKAEAGAAHAAQALLELDRIDPARWPTTGHDHPEGGFSSRGPASPPSRATSSPPPQSRGATAEVQAGPP